MAGSALRKIPAELRELIEFSGGFTDWTVEMLLQQAGAKRVGARILEQIEANLAEMNVGHLPTRLPHDRHRRVLLYSQEHPGAGVILHLTRLLAEDPSRLDPADADRYLTMLLIMLKASQTVGEKKTATPVGSGAEHA